MLTKRKCTAFMLAMTLAFLNILQPVATAYAFFEKSSQNSTAQKTSEQIAQENLDSKMKVLDSKTDVADLGNGKKVYRLYDVARPQFDKNNPQRIKSSRKGGYEFSLVSPKSSVQVVVTSGTVRYGKTILYPAQSVVESSVVDTVTTSTLASVYPNLDVQFVDQSDGQRERNIIVKERLKDLQPNDVVTFWENYTLPAGTRVTDDQGVVLKQGQKMLGKKVILHLSDGALFSIGATSVYDSRVGERVLKDMGQIIHFNDSHTVLSIGAQLDASYLLDSERVYPVVVDPIYNACRAPTNNVNNLAITCNIGLTGFILRNTGSQLININDIVFGWNGNQVAANSDTQIPIFKFDIASLPANHRIDQATFYMVLRSVDQNNNNNHSIDLSAWRITDWWDAGARTDTPQSATYGNLRSRMSVEASGITLRDNLGAGAFINYNLSTLVNGWYTNSIANHGILLAPSGANTRWLNGNVPPVSWPGTFWRFYFNRNGELKRPYLEVRATDNRPDLVVQNGGNTVITVTNPNPQRGETFSTTAPVENIGGGNMPVGTTVPLRVTDAAGNRWGSANIPNLAARDLRNVTFNLTVPANAQLGNTTLTYTVDPDNGLPESFENNNTATMVVNVQRVGQPDLTFVNPARLQEGAPYYPGNPLTIDLRVINANDPGGNNAAAASSNVYYYFHAGTPSYDAGFRVDSDTFSALAVGVSSQEYSNFTIAPGTPAGRYYYSFYIDPNNDVPNERDATDNNNRASFTIDVSSGMNLVPLNPVLANPGNKSGGDQLNVSVQVQNTGNQNAPNVGARLILKNIDTNAQYVLNNMNPVSLNLPAGSDQQFNVSGTIPGNVPQGVYRVMFSLDYNNDYQEYGSGENDNIIYAADSIGLGGFCSGQCGGGVPPPSNSLPDSDNDGFPDVEERTGGTNVNGAQVSNLFDASWLKYFSATTDKKQNSYGADPVNLRTGSFELSETDFALKGRGIPIRIERTYDSLLTDRNNRAGSGWNMSTSLFYYQDPTTHDVQIYLGGAFAALFTTPDNGVTFTSPKGTKDILIIENDSFVYKTKNGIRYIFSKKLTSNMGALERIVDTHGNTTTFTYQSVQDIPLITSITDASGRRIDLTYGDPADNSMFDKVVLVHDSVGENARDVHYEYTNGNLTAVRTTRTYQGVAEEIIERYAYDANGKLIDYTTSRGKILRNTYDAQGRVTSQSEHNPRVDAPDSFHPLFDVTYQDSGDPAIANSTACTSVKNYRNRDTSYTYRECYDANGLKLSIEDEASHRELYEYNADGMPTRITDATGHVTLNQYDARRRLTHTTLPDTAKWHTEIEYAYEDAFNVLTRKTETATPLAGGNPVVRTTTYEVDSANGNVTATIDAEGNVVRFEYDANGNLAAKIDARGSRTTYQYDPNGNYVVSESVTVTAADGQQSVIIKRSNYDVYGTMTDSIDARNNTSTYTSDTWGNTRSTTDPLNGVSRMTVDSMGHPTTVIDAMGRVTNYVYDTDNNESLLQEDRVGQGETLTTRKEYDYVGNVTREIDARGNAVQYTYDSGNRVTQKMAPISSVSYGYDAGGNKISEITNGGNRIEYVYDARNNITAVRRFISDNNSVVDQYEYDGFNRKVRVVDPRGGVTQFEYDALGRVIGTTLADGSRLSYSYDDNGNKIAESDARGAQTTYEYDEVNRLRRSVNAAGFITEYFYDPNGNIVKKVDRHTVDGSNSNHITTYEYDALNRKTAEVNALGGRTEYTYDVVGNVKTKRDPLGHVTTYDYDDFNRVIAVHDPAGAVTAYTYDQNGNKLTERFSDNTVNTYVYDAQNRLIRITDALGQVIQNEYDVVGNRTRSVDRNNHETVFVYDGLSRLISERNAQGTITEYQYDASGNRVTESVAGKQTAYTYDSLNRVTQITHAPNEIDQTQYDANGNIVAQTSSNGKMTQYQYDVLNQPILKTLADGRTVAITYDNWGNPTEVLDSRIGQTLYSYDLLGREVGSQRNLNQLLTVQDPPHDSFDSTRTYNADGTLASVTDAGGTQISYVYDVRGLLSAVAIGQRQIANYNYDSRGNVTSLTYHTQGGDMVTNFGYDQLTRPTQYSLTNTQNQSIFQHAYTYDPEGNRLQTSESVLQDGAQLQRTIAYSYDTLNQLTGINYSTYPGDTDIAIEYDQWGNRTRMVSPRMDRAYTYAQNNDELTSVSLNNNRARTTYTYDQSGLLINEINTRNNRTLSQKTYTWDAENKLAGVQTTPGANAHQAQGLPGYTNATYVYDFEGNRVVKDGVMGKTVYLYDSTGLRNELDESGAITKTMVYGLGPIAQVQGNSVTFMFRDVLGSTLYLSDDAGVIVRELEYDPFGNAIGSIGAGEVSQQFTGKEYDEEVGLNYFIGRYYDPLLGRFISRDSFGGVDGNSITRNRFTYVNNNPFAYVDPTGHEAKKVVGAAINAFIPTIFPLTSVVLGDDNVVGAARTSREILHSIQSSIYDYAGKQEAYNVQLKVNAYAVGFIVGDVLGGAAENVEILYDRRQPPLDRAINGGLLALTVVPVVDEVALGGRLVPGLVSECLTVCVNGAKAASPVIKPLLKTGITSINAAARTIEGASKLGMEAEEMPALLKGINSGAARIAQQSAELASSDKYLIDNVAGIAKNGLRRIGMVDEIQPTDDVIATLRNYDSNGYNQLPNIKAPKTFNNDARAFSQALPKVDDLGNDIKYTEYYVNPRQPEVGLGRDRFVKGSDGRIWYTDDHYYNFVDVTNQVR